MFQPDQGTQLGIRLDPVADAPLTWAAEDEEISHPQDGDKSLSENYLNCISAPL